MTWIDGNLIAIDTETTSANPYEAIILQACIGFSERPGHFDPAVLWVPLPDGVTIPTESTAVHGITAESLAARCQGSRRPTLFDLASRLRSAAVCGIPVVGHNLRYDLTVIWCELAREGIDAGFLPDLIVIDTLVLYRRLWTQTGSRSLGKLAERHGIVFPAHDAEADALASLRLLHILAGSHDLLKHVPAHTLHQLEAEWWADAQESDAAKAAGNGVPRPPETGWPIAKEDQP